MAKNGMVVLSMVVTWGLVHAKVWRRQSKREPIFSQIGADKPRGRPHVPLLCSRPCAQSLQNGMNFIIGLLRLFPVG